MSSGPIIIRLQGIPHRVEWGFLLENTYFQRFEEHNQKIIEQAYHELCHLVGNHYIDITDAVLANSARVYFGVEQIHLRMPGTRYYVQRRLSSLINTTASRSSPAILSHSCPRQLQRQPEQQQQQQHLKVSTEFSSSLQQKPRPSISSPASLVHTRRSTMTHQRSRADSESTTSSNNNNGGNSTITPSVPTNNNNKRGIRNMRRSSSRYSNHSNTVNSVGSAPRKGQRQPTRRIQKSSNATTTNSTLTPVSTAASSIGAALALNVATTNLTSQQQQDQFDWAFSSRLVTKPSQDYSQQSITSPSTPSPQSSPNIMHQKPVIASFQYPADYTNIAMGNMQLQYQQYQYQQDQQLEQQESLHIKSVIAPLSDKRSYKQKVVQPVPATSIATAIPISTNCINFSDTIYGNSCATTSNNGNNNDNTTAKSDNIMNCTNYNNNNNSSSSLTDINNYEPITALSNAVSMTVTPQDSVHDPNQVTFLPQQAQREEQQQNQDVLLLNHLSNIIPVDTAQQVWASWSCTPEIPITTHIQENPFAAGSINFQTTFNNNNYLPDFTTSNNERAFHQ